jgi:hypothetical protein
MLRYLGRIDWLPLTAATLALVLSVDVLSSLGFPHHNQSDKGADQATGNEPVEHILSFFLSLNAEGWTALFTAVLTVSTIALWWVTYAIARDADQSSKGLLSMERPYVTGGGDFENEWGTEFFRLDVENHGKTAAFMTGYDLQFAKLTDIVNDPTVKPVCERIRHIDGISPQGARKMIRTQRKRPPGDDIVFGAIYYRDIFNKPHHSRFILRIASSRDIPREGLTRLDIDRRVSELYWSWDIDENEGA